MCWQVRQRFCCIRSITGGKHKIIAEAKWCCMNIKSALAVRYLYKVDICMFIGAQHNALHGIYFAKVTAQGHGSKTVAGTRLQERIDKINSSRIFTGDIETLFRIKP